MAERKFDEYLYKTALVHGYGHGYEDATNQGKTMSDENIKTTTIVIHNLNCSDELEKAEEAEEGTVTDEIINVLSHLETTDIVKIINAAESIANERRNDAIVQAKNLIKFYDISAYELKEYADQPTEAGLTD